MYIDTEVHEQEIVPYCVALRFLRSHDGLPMVRMMASGKIQAWSETVGPGGEYVEKMEFEPDALGEFDLTAIKQWLGY